MSLRAPFPWFGGKSRVAELVWERFGDTPNYVEPFAGSLAVLLARPHAPRIETVNDRDCYLANFWRAVQADPEEVARWADWPVNEADLHARHRWLVNRTEWREKMLTDPDHFDARIAGWWVWGICQWIGGHWCRRPDWRGRCDLSWARGIHAKRPSLGKGGRGVHRHDPPRKLPLIGGTRGTGVHRSELGLARQLPDLHGSSGAAGRGVHASGLSRKLPKMDRGTDSRTPSRAALVEWFGDLQERLRKVRVACGDWTRVLGDSPTIHVGVTAVFLDPPYAHDAGRDPDIYAEEDGQVSGEVRAWALEHGRDSRLRIALCGYEGEHEMPGWTVLAWQAHGGYGVRFKGNRALKDRGRNNRRRERIWFSPSCLRPQRPLLFEETSGSVGL